MGSSVDLSGRIEIDPPIPWREFGTSPYYRLYDPAKLLPWYQYELQFEIKQWHVETDDGVMAHRQAVAIIPFDGDDMRGRDIEQILQAIADQHGEGRTFTGRIEARWPDHEGSERRYKIIDGRVREFEPMVVWPGESE